MPYIRLADGSFRWVNEADVVAGLQSGQGFDQSAQVNVVDQDGVTQAIAYTPEAISQAADQGYRLQADQEAEAQAEQREFTTGGAQFEAGWRGAARAATFGLSDWVGDQERIKKIREYNPWTSMLSEGGTIALSALAGNWTGAGKLLSLGTTLPRKGLQAAEAVGRLAGEGRLAQAALRGTAEGAIFGAGQTITDLALADPGTQGEIVARDMLVNVLGGALGEVAFAGVGGWMAKRFAGAAEAAPTPRVSGDKAPGVLARATAAMAGVDADDLARVDVRKAADADNFLLAPMHQRENGSVGSLSEKIADDLSQMRADSLVTRAQSGSNKYQNMYQIATPDRALESTADVLKELYDTRDEIERMVTAGGAEFARQSDLKMVRTRITNAINELAENVKVTRKQNPVSGVAEWEDTITADGLDIANPDVARALKNKAFNIADGVKRDIGSVSSNLAKHVTSTGAAPGGMQSPVLASLDALGDRYLKVRDLLEDVAKWGDQAAVQKNMNIDLTEHMGNLRARIKSNIWRQDSPPAGYSRENNFFGPWFNGDADGVNRILKAMMTDEMWPSVAKDYEILMRQLKSGAKVAESTLQNYGGIMQADEILAVENHIKKAQEIQRALTQAKEYGDAARAYRRVNRKQEDSLREAIASVPVAGPLLEKYFPVPTPGRYLALKANTQKLAGRAREIGRVFRVNIADLKPTAAPFLPFASGGARMASDKARDEEYRRTKGYLDQLQDPSALALALEPVADLVNNGTITGAMLSAYNALGHLQATLPRETAPQGAVALLRGQQGHVDRRKRDEWLSRVAVVRDPAVITQAIRSGTLTPAMVDTLRTVYPSVYTALVAAYSQAVAKSRKDLTRQQQSQISMLIDPAGATRPTSQPPATPPQPAQQPAGKTMSAAKGELMSNIITGSKTKSERLS